MIQFEFEFFPRMARMVADRRTGGMSCRVRNVGPDLVSGPCLGFAACRRAAALHSEHGHPCHEIARSKVERLDLKTLPDDWAEPARWACPPWRGQRVPPPEPLLIDNPCRSVQSVPSTHLSSRLHSESSIAGAGGLPGGSRAVTGAATFRSWPPRLRGGGIRVHLRLPVVALA